MCLDERFFIAPTFVTVSKLVPNKEYGLKIYQQMSEYTYLPLSGKRNGLSINGVSQGETQMDNTVSPSFEGVATATAEGKIVLRFNKLGNHVHLSKVEVSILNSGSKLKKGESSHSGCTSDGGCHVQIWCKSLFVQQKEELNIGSSFALISSLTTNALPTWKRFNTLKSTEGDSFVESSIALSPISQPLYIGGTYRHSTSETPVDVGVFRLYPKHLTAEEIKGNYNALAPRYGKNIIARRRMLRDDTPGVSSVFGISGVPGAAEVAEVAKHRRRRLAYETNVEMGTLDAGSATPISLIIPSFSKNMQDIGGLGDYFEVCGVSDATSNCPTTSLRT